MHCVQKVEDAATGNTGVWITFLAILVLYAVVATTLVLVLRLMSRRFREQGVDVELEGPYSPRVPVTSGDRDG